MPLNLFTSELPGALCILFLLNGFLKRNKNAQQSKKPLTLNLHLLTSYLNTFFAG